MSFLHHKHKPYLKEMCRLFNMMILYSSAPSSTTCRRARSDGAPDSTAVRQAGSPKVESIRILGPSLKNKFLKGIVIANLMFTFVWYHQVLFMSGYGLIKHRTILILIWCHEMVLMKFNGHSYSRSHNLKANYTKSRLVTLQYVCFFISRYECQQ